MDSKSLMTALASGIQAASIASMDALKDDDKVRQAARHALACSPFVFQSTVMATIGTQGFENAVLKLRDLVLPQLGNYRSDIGIEDIKRGFNDVLSRGISLQSLLGEAVHSVIGGPALEASSGQQMPMSPSELKAMRDAARPAPAQAFLNQPSFGPRLPQRAGAMSPGAAPIQDAPIPALPSMPLSPVEQRAMPSGSRKLKQSEVESLIADDTTPDEVIAPYLRSVPSQRFPLVPVLEFDPTRVEISPHRGVLDLGLRALNDRTNRRRLSEWQFKMDGGWQGLRLLAEGDSWFLYPILLRDVVDNLSTDFAVYSVAEAGDTLYNMARGTARLQKLLETHEFDALVFSAGGNDLAGDQLAKYLYSHPLPARPAAEYITDAYKSFLASSQAQLRELFTSLWAKSPSLRVFLHGYDWPSPRSQGAWLMPAMRARSIPDSCQAAILKIMIDNYYTMLFDLERVFPGQISVVDCRGLAGAPENWFDELHPSNSGFARVADKFRQTICGTFGLPYESRPEPTASVWWRTSGLHVRSTSEGLTLLQGVATTVGRGQDCNIRLDDGNVSRRHAILTLTAAGIEIEDTNSTNGTFLENRKIAKAVWSPGQRLQIGNSIFEMNLVEAAPTTASVLGVLATVSPKALFEIEFCNENLTAQPHESWAIGLFEGVNAFAARGAARAIDEFVGGGLWEALDDCANESRLGNMMPIPLVDAKLKKRKLLLLGLGSLREFSPEILKTLGHNLACAMVENQIAEVATVPIGGNSGLSADMAANSFLIGFANGVKAFDPAGVVKRITVCELDPERFAKLVEGTTNLREAEPIKAASIKIKVTEPDVSSDPGLTGPAGQVHQLQRTNKIYLEVCSINGTICDFTLLGAPGAAIPPRVTMPVELAANLLIMLNASCCPSIDDELGHVFADTFIPPSLQIAIEQQFVSAGADHLVIIHDAFGAALPWEAAMINARPLALVPGLSRQYRPAARTRSTSVPPRRKSDKAGRLRMLLAFDPTCDLVGAEHEAIGLQKIFAESGGEVTTLSREGCTKDAVLEALGSKEYDILHFAGHGRFTNATPEMSGIVLAGTTFLSASDLETLPAVPRLIFLNACQSGRMRSSEASLTRTDHASLAEALILRNVQQFVGTYWLVGDTAAYGFSLCFYEQLMQGNSIGSAIADARAMLRNQKHPDWVNYMHFGDPSEQLRRFPT